jgi:hypothetical protein
MSEKSAASGRPAVGLTRDSDYEDFIRGVHSLPEQARKGGIEVALVWADTELRSFVDVLILAHPRTESGAKAQQRVHIALNEGAIRVMCRDDLAGLRCRSDFIRAVERSCLAPTLRAVFEKSRDESGDGEGEYEPQTGD